LQKDLYGDRSPVLLFTWKNIGTCYLGIGQSDQALKYFVDCIGLLQELPVDDDKEAVKTKDKVELMSLKQNLYLTHATDRNFELALEMAESCIELSADLYGPRSKKLSAKLYQKATSLLQLGKKEEAVEAIKKSIEIYENPEEKEVTIEEKEGMDSKVMQATEE
jgi:tetratricopeptide (TPR) repeat protein